MDMQNVGVWLAASTRLILQIAPLGRQ